MTVKIKVAEPGPAKKVRDRSKETRVEGRWRLDFSRRDRGFSSESIEQRRARTRQWLQHNYPHVLRPVRSPPEGSEGNEE